MSASVLTKPSTGNPGSQPNSVANKLYKPLTTFSIQQKPTKSYSGISHSKSSNDVTNSVAASTATVVNANSSAAFAQNLLHSHFKNNDNANSGYQRSGSKIPKSASSFVIKQVEQPINQSKTPTNLKNNQTSTSTTSMSKSIMETIVPTAATQSNTNGSIGSSKLRLPSFKKLRNKLSMRKSHSTASNLSDIAKLKISTSNTSSNLIPAAREFLNQTNPNQSTNKPTPHTNKSEQHINYYNNHNNNSYNHNSIATEPVQAVSKQKLNYRSGISMSDAPIATLALKVEEIDDIDLYNAMVMTSCGQVAPMPPMNAFHNAHHDYNHYRFIENGFSAIQEEQMPNSLVEASLERSALNMHHAALNANAIQASSSSSSSSLNNHNQSNTNSSNSQTLTINNHGHGNGHMKALNYGSSLSNTTTGTTTSNSLNSDMVSTSTASPHTHAPLTNHHIDSIEYYSSEPQHKPHVSQHTPNKNSPSRMNGIGSFFSSLSSTFSLSSSSANNANVKLRQNKAKSKSELQKRISLPANYNNHLLGLNQSMNAIGGGEELNGNYINNTPPLIENEEFTNENSNQTTVKYKQHMGNSNVLNNNLNVRNNLQSNMLTKHGYNSNHHLNHYAKHTVAHPTSRINNSMSINQLDSHNTNCSNMQSYQSLSTIAMRDKGVGANIIMIKPLNRNSRRASMSELGYGKIESYNKLDKLGEGTYATVFKGQSTINGSFVALKEIRLEHEEGAPCTAIREVSILKQLKHANIVTLHDIIYSPKVLTLVFEYLEKDLKQYMDDCNNIMSIKNVKLFLFQLLRGLAYCHARQILHRDLKPQNLLINQKGELKLADFGLARAKSIPTKTYSNEVVTLWYRPPDVLLGSTDYSTDIDMWGVGCIFYEMVCGKPLFPGTKVEDELYLIFKTLGLPDESSFPGVTTNSDYLALHLPNFARFDSANIAKLVPRLDSDGSDLLASYLKFDPKLRSSASESIKYSFFSSLPPSLYKLGNGESLFNSEYKDK